MGSFVPGPIELLIVGFLCLLVFVLPTVLLIIYFSNRSRGSGRTETPPVRHQTRGTPALLECPACGAKLEASADRCSACGLPLHE